MNMHQAYICLDYIDGLRRDMIVKSLSIGINVTSNEQDFANNNGLDSASSRSTISSDDCVCRWVQEGVDAPYDNNTNEDDIVCTCLQLDQSFVVDSKDEINDNFQFESEEHDHIIRNSDVDEEKELCTNEKSDGSNFEVNCVECTHNDDVKDGQEISFFLSILPSFVSS